MKSIFEQNGGTYTRVGDYYIPNITVPETNGYTIGKYGQLRRKFLKEHHKSYYSSLLITGKIFKHLAEIDKTCHICLQDMITKMAEQEGITEELKATDQMDWVQKMNGIRNRAEEVVFVNMFTKFKDNSENIICPRCLTATRAIDFRLPLKIYHYRKRTA